jgi:hypothetical protein
MENQHRKIKGYRELSADEIAAMNAVKELSAAVGEHLQAMEGFASFDQRWVAIAKTDLQKGFMAATRAIAKPEFF